MITKAVFKRVGEFYTVTFLRPERVVVPREKFDFELTKLGLAADHEVTGKVMEMAEGEEVAVSLELNG